MDRPDPKYSLGQELRLPTGEVGSPTKKDPCFWGGHFTWSYWISGQWYFEESLKDYATSKPYEELHAN